MKQHVNEGPSATTLLFVYFDHHSRCFNVLESTQPTLVFIRLFQHVSDANLVLPCQTHSQGPLYSVNEQQKQETYRVKMSFTSEEPEPDTGHLYEEK